MIQGAYLTTNCFDSMKHPIVYPSELYIRIVLLFVLAPRLNLWFESICFPVLVDLISFQTKTYKLEITLSPSPSKKNIFLEEARTSLTSLSLHLPLLASSSS